MSLRSIPARRRLIRDVGDLNLNMAIPTDIATAVENLLSLESQQIGRKIPKEEWNTLCPAVSALFPDWYRELMSQYPLAGREFDVDEEDFYQGELHLWEPPFIDSIQDEQELTCFYGIDFTAESSGFPFCHLPDGEIVIATGQTFETALAAHFNGIGFDEGSLLNGQLSLLFSRLLPSDFEGGVA